MFDFGEYGTWADTGAYFYGPYGLFFKNGRLYVADRLNAGIRVFYPDGTIDRAFGGPGSGLTEAAIVVTFSDDGSALIADPTDGKGVFLYRGGIGDFLPVYYSVESTNWYNKTYGLALDPSEDSWYVSDHVNKIITHFDFNINQYNVAAVWGTQDPFSGLAGLSVGYQDLPLSGPVGMSFDNEYNMYIADADSNTILKVNYNGEYIRKYDNSGQCEGQFWDPIDIAVDASGNNVYVVDYYAVQIFNYKNNVYRFSKYLIPDSTGSNKGGVALGSDGIYFSNSDTNEIIKINSDGNILARWGHTGTADGEFTNPAGIAVDPSGFVYVADSDNNRIQKFKSGGGFVTSWGGYGNADGEFKFPTGIAVAGNYVYVADYSNSRIQKFTVDGIFVTKFSTGSYSLPTGVDVDSDVNIFVTDEGPISYNSNRVLIFDKDGTLKDIIKDEINGGFSYPHGVAVDGKGRVYVADRGNDVIKTFQAGVDPLTFTSAPGMYTGSMQVEIACATSGAVIRYTTDGTEPDESSKVYLAPLTFNPDTNVPSITTTLKAKAFKDSYTPSETQTGVYTIITPVVDAPTFTPAPGSYQISVKVTIACQPAGR